MPTARAWPGEDGAWTREGGAWTRSGEARPRVVRGAEARSSSGASRDVVELSRARTAARRGPSLGPVWVAHALRRAPLEQGRTPEKHIGEHIAERIANPYAHDAPLGVGR